ncbi:hypothetical protein [Streptomyces sp. x-80]|uniref:hypothetical protein n=1 Tax=Streptomyces sp. x-80 TaxID=2789282 RepID=UPI003981475B
MNHAKLPTPRRQPGALSPLPGAAPNPGGRGRVWVAPPGLPPRQHHTTTPETGVVPETIEQALDWAAPTVEGPLVSERLAVIALVVLIAVGVVTLTLASTPARI